MGAIASICRSAETFWKKPLTLTLSSDYDSTAFGSEAQARRELAEVRGEGIC
jgi:hypothetical protein